MLENELQDLRRFQWRVDTSTRAIFTVDDAREFLHNVGFCLEYPLRSPVLAPTFIGAVIGSDQNLPTAKYAFIHPRAKEATEFKDRLLREKSAFEAGFGEDDNLLISAIEFPYFYALIGDRNPKVPPSAGERGERLLLQRAFELIQEHGPILETALREHLGETVSDVALSRTLSELRQKLRIVRIEDTGGPVWDLLMRWSPQVVNQGKQISAQEALSALVGKYLETCVAAEQKDIEEFFGHLVPRSRVAEVIKALLAAREFSFIQVNSKNLLRNSPRISAEEKAAQIAAAAAPKPQGRANRSFQPRAEGAEPKQNVWEKYGPKKDRGGADFDKRPKREDGSWIKPADDARPEKSSAPFAKKAWKKDGPARPWQKPAGDGPSGERSFRPAGDRPPQRSGAPREARAGGFGAKPEWKKSARPGGFGDRGPKKFGAPGSRPAGPKFGAKKFDEGRPAAAGPRIGAPDKAGNPREGGTVAAGSKREWKKFGDGGPKKFGDRGPKFGGAKPKFGGAKKFGAKKFGAKKFGERPPDGAPRKEWKKRPDSKEFGASRFQAKFGAKKPWEKRSEPESPGSKDTATSERRESGGVEAPPFKKAPFKKAGFKKAPFKKTGGFSKPGGKPGGPFKKAGQAGDGFKKSFKKPFKKAFAKKSARPSFGAKPRRPA